MERYLRVNLVGPVPRLMKKKIYRAAVSQKLRNTALNSSNLLVLVMQAVCSMLMMIRIFVYYLHKFRASMTSLDLRVI